MSRDPAPARPLAIGVVCFPSLGGSGVVAAQLAGGLADRGHQVHLMASAPPGRVAAGAPPGLSFHEVVTPTYPLLAHAPYDLAVAGTILAVARRHRLDLLHVHYAVPHATSALLARQVLGAAAPRVVVSLHGTDVTHVGAEPLLRDLTRHAVAAADGVTAPSAFLRAEARTRLGLAERTHVEVIANFVETDRFAPVAVRERARLHGLFAAPLAPAAAAAAPVLFHVSTFRAVKRVKDLFEVLGRVRRAGVPARLVLVGDGPERPAAEAHAAALGLTADVAFLGRRADFTTLLPHADAFLLPSESESFGVAALEALSAGVPVLAYRVGGLADVVAPGTGELVTPFDVDALARATIALVTSPERHAAWSQAARARVLANFRHEPAIDRYEAYFRRVLDRGVPERA